MPDSEHPVPERDTEPLFWRAIPMRSPPWPQAFVVMTVALLVAVGIWVIYRVIRGWLALSAGKPLPV